MFETNSFINGPNSSEIGEQCPNCDNVGWYGTTNHSSNPWEAEQVQCEFCYTNPNSIFNLKKINEVG